MLHTSNPEIDSARLQQHVERVAVHGRHPRPLALPPLADVQSRSRQGSAWRQWLRRVPLLGDVLVWGRERWWRMRTPGLSRAQRLRAVPVVGDLAAWGLALITLPRWRAELRDQLAAQQAQMQDLRNQQVRLQQELQRLRAASAKPPGGHLGRLPSASRESGDVR